MKLLLLAVAGGLLFIGSASANTCAIALSGATTNFSATTAGNWTSCGGVKPQSGDNLSVTGGSSRVLVLDTPLTLGTGQDPYRGYPVAITGSVGGSTTCSAAPGLAGTAQRAGFLSCKVVAGACTPYIGDRGAYSATGTTNVSSICSGGSPSLTLSWNAGGGTPAILVALGTQVVFKSNITVRGDVLGVDVYADTSTSFRFSAGGHLVFDFSLSTNAPVYNLGIQGTGGTPPYARTIETDGTCNPSACSIGTTGGGVWRSDRMSATQGPEIDLENVTLSNLGDASTLGIVYAGHPTRPFTLIGNNIDSAALLYLGVIPDGDDIVIQNNYFTNSIVSNFFNAGAGAVSLLAGDFDSTFTSGTRLIQGNSMDLPVWNSAQMTGVTIRDNVIRGTGVTIGGSHLPTAWTNNALFVTSATSGTTMNQMPMDHNIFWTIGPVSNWHTFSQVNGTTLSMTYNIFGLSTANTGDSGEIMGIGTTSATVTFSNNIILSGATGLAWAEPGSSPLTTSQRSITDHNYWWNDYGSTPAGFGFYDVNEGGNTTSGYIQSMKCNTLWSNRVHPNTALKIGNILHAPIVSDPGAPANVDYNYGWGTAATQASCTGCTNQVRGYAAAWTTPPGVHDNDDIDPGVDYQRKLETFPTDYLKFTAARGTWSGAVDYAKADTVSDSQPTLFWGKVIAYTCINAGGCPASAGQRPGSGSTWYAYWEPYAVTWITQQVGAHATYVDGSLVVYGLGEDTACSPSSPCDAITAVRHWIYAGLRPSNPAFWGACGADDEAVGPIDIPIEMRSPPSLTVN